MKEDVVRPVVAPIGVLDRHVHLASRALGEPEIPDLVVRGRGRRTGVCGRPAERARRRDRGGLRLAQPLEQAPERLGLDDPIELAAVRRDEADAADEHVVDGPPCAHAREAILHGDLALARRQDLCPDGRGGLVERFPFVDDPAAHGGLELAHVRLLEPSGEEPDEFRALSRGIAAPVLGDRPPRHLGEVEERRGHPVDLRAPLLGVGGTGQLGVAQEPGHLPGRRLDDDVRRRRRDGRRHDHQPRQRGVAHRPRPSLEGLRARETARGLPAFGDRRSGNGPTVSPPAARPPSAAESSAAPRPSLRPNRYAEFVIGGGSRRSSREGSAIGSASQARTAVVRLASTANSLLVFVNGRIILGSHRQQSLCQSGWAQRRPS